MAESNVSIDKNKLPGVKEVCRDFAVLEDHCLAYNLQEQEIESHLASNVHKSRLVQKDLQVAKKLQEEEDEIAKIQNQKQHIDIERQDNEIAQEIQEELVRQAEQQRQQEEKDAAIARKLQEKEMKEERKRQKQMETNFDEDYFEDHGAARQPLDLDEHLHHKSSSPHAHTDPHFYYSPDQSSRELKKSRNPKLDSAAPYSHSTHPEHHLVAERGHSKYADPYPEHLMTSRGKHSDAYPESAQTGRARGPSWEDTERVVKQKERPAKSPPVQIERDKVWDRDRHHDRGRDYEWERQMRRDHRRDREQDRRVRGRDREGSNDRGQSVDRERDRMGQKDRERHRARIRSIDRLADGHRDMLPGRERPNKSRASWEEEESESGRNTRGRQRVHSGPEEVFCEFPNGGRRGESYDPRHGEGPSRERSHSHLSGETGRIVHRGSGAVIAETEYGLDETTKDMKKLDIREQEIIDMEVARKLHEEEMKATNMQVRAAQMAQDEEIARLLMEQEKKEYKKNREREKEKERERERLAMERMAMERRRAEGDHRPHPEEVVRPRTRDEHEYQRHKNHKPTRPAQPRQHNYENVSAGYGYSDHQVAPRASARPEAALKGAYYKR